VYKNTQVLCLSCLQVFWAHTDGPPRICYEKDCLGTEFIETEKKEGFPEVIKSDTLNHCASSGVCRGCLAINYSQRTGITKSKVVSVIMGLFGLYKITNEKLKACKV